MILASLFELIGVILAMGAFSFAVLAILAATVLRLLARQRVLEIRMAERLALVRRGLHPHTYQPLPASESLEPGALTVVRPS